MTWESRSEGPADEVAAEIKKLSLADKFRLVADCLDAGAKVTPGVARSLARHAMSELEAK